MQGKDYQDQITRLKYEQELAIKDTEEQIHKWKGFKSDYEALKQRLTTLPDKITHDVMVPFGKMAFMPGHLVHTNEVLVLLGDNWFAERSAKQAVGIVNRRVKQIDKQLEDLDKQKKLLEPRRDFTSDLQELGRDGMETFDLREEYDEERERLWKEKHKEKLKKHRQRLQEDSHKKDKSVKTKSKMEDEDAKLWERLDELERIESEGRELEKIGLEENIQEPHHYPRETGPRFDANQQADNSVVRVRHNEANIKTMHDTEKDGDTESDECSEVTDTSEELDSDDEDSFSGEKESDEPVTGGKVINFSHSTTSDNTGAETTASDTIHPGTLYSRFYANRQPKSILKKTVSEPKKSTKKKKRSRVVEFDTASDTDERSRKSVQSQQTSVLPAFTGKVVEKQMSTKPLQPQTGAIQKSPVSLQKNPVSDLKTVQQDQKTVTVKSDEPAENVKPVSRFKARKQNKVET